MAHKKHFGIIAATFAGNRGAEAMLLSTIDHLRVRDPLCVVHVLSYSPEADQQELSLRPIPGVYIHSATPKTLVLKWFMLSVLAKVLPFLRKPPQERHDQGILSLLGIDALFCLAGVSFIDGREKFLPFNVLTLFPFLVSGIPVFKMAQALGRIGSPLNLICAKWTLPRLRFLFARGQITASFIEEAKVLPGSRWEVCPDIAFGLQYVPPTLRIGDVALVPSVILDKKHARYRDFLVELVELLHAKGITTSFVVHSWKSNTSKPFNNDLPLTKDLAHRLLAKGISVKILGEGKDAREIKTLIAAHRLCLTSRFHGMIASLDAGLPTLVIGWSHKYREILALFQRESWALKFDQLSAPVCASTIEDVLSKEDAERHALLAALPALRKDVDASFNKVWEMLRS